MNNEECHTAEPEADDGGGAKQEAMCGGQRSTRGGMRVVGWKRSRSGAQLVPGRVERHWRQHDRRCCQFVGRRRRQLGSDNDNVKH